MSEFCNKKFLICARVSTVRFCFCWLYRTFIFGCKEYNESKFNIDDLVMSMYRVISCVVGRECLLWPVCSVCITLLAFALLHFVPKGKFACYSRYLLTFAFQFPMMKRTSFWSVSSRRSCRSSKNYSTSAFSALLVGAQTWVTVVLNALPRKWTEIILSFLRLHQSTRFWILCANHFLTNR